MKTYIAVIIVIIIIAFGVWFLIKEDKGGENIITPVENQSAAVGNAGGTGGSEAENETIKKMTSAILHTSKGDITIEFFEAQTPNTVANFIKLAKAGFYDGTKFHRVIEGFMIQGGDPLTKDDSKISLWGTGGPGYAFKDEIGGTNSNNKNNKGTISMANAGKDTNGSQFFINTADNNFLDGKHTVFGKVVAGMDVVTEIENTATGANDRPIAQIVIQSVSLK